MQEEYFRQKEKAPPKERLIKASNLYHAGFLRDCLDSSDTAINQQIVTGDEA